ncbi:binding partner of ACD11 1-like isoform X2 [Punica granatum]|uniref:Binding partner of ACD11 1-like isoform X2 n=1 Tax=Punica granatum TaxID=22663 RepID=A0A6P8C8W3_PUNGR|nr:binding partner of ACD11 1-like isoform X2 [Punica granatum]
MLLRTVQVSNLSLGASEQDIRDFFSFSGEIEHVEMQRDNERCQTAFVTFKDPKGAETASLLTGATIVDQMVAIILAPNYKPPTAGSQETGGGGGGGGGGGAVQKAEDVVSSMLARGYILGKDALNRAKAFDEKHQFTSTASAKMASLDQKIGLSEKISAGATMVNEKVREVDNKFQVSEKTRHAFAAAEQTASSAGSAIKRNRYLLLGASLVAGAYSRVAKAAGDVGHKAQEKVSSSSSSHNQDQDQDQQN